MTSDVRASGGKPLAYDSGTACLQIYGDWTLPNHERLADAVGRSTLDLGRVQRLDLMAVGALDTAGVALMVRLIGASRLLELLAGCDELPTARRALIEAVARAMVGREHLPPRPATSAFADFFAHVGEGVLSVSRHVVDLLGFLGITLATMLRVGINPFRWRMTSLVAHLEQTGLDAVPIVALLTFLVGAVIAFLGATVLDDFGASIYTVNLVAYAFLREFG